MRLKHLIGGLLVFLLGSGIARAQEDYNFSICGVRVTSENVDDLSEISGVTVGDGGYITYSPESNMLKIKNVTLQQSGESSCISVGSGFGGDPFVLHVEGKNKFSSPSYAPLLTEFDMHIEGSGSLVVRSECPGIYIANSVRLTIKDCSIDIVSKSDTRMCAGIGANASEDPRLVIKNANLYAKATGIKEFAHPYAVGELESILLEGVTITEPRNGVVGSYTFRWDGNLYTSQFIMSGDKPAGEVRIERSLAVETVDLPDLCISPNPADRLVCLEGAEGGMTVSLYSLQGARQLSVTTDQLGVANLDVSHLPSGSYILVVGGNELKLVVRH